MTRRWRIEFTFPHDPELGAAIITATPDTSEVITQWAREWLHPLHLSHVAVQINDGKTEAAIYASAQPLPIEDDGTIPAQLKVGTATIITLPTKD